MSKRFSKFVISSATLGGLAAVLLSAAGPAEAKRMSCIAKYRACNQRCAASAGANGDWVPCIQRTCNRQYDNCAEGGGGRAGLVAPTRPGPVVSGPQSPRGPVNPGPFPPGGMRQNGGIFPGGMRHNGGFVPTGSIFRSAHGRR